MSGWNGFTEKELRLMKEETVNEQQHSVSTVRPSKIDQQRRKKNREKKIAKPKVANKESEHLPTTDEMKEELKDKQINGVRDPPVQNNQEESNKSLEVVEKVSDENINIVVLSDEKVAELEMSSLEKLQLQQKLMEDQNKKKQIMIKEALAERFKQTHSESQKLKSIQKQLSHLDQILQADVEILRNKIDEACVLFSHAQRRYEAAEKEYVSSKIDYHQKREIKEELTEHLYAIIQENEMRKAKKLEELMQKLTSASDSVPSSPISPLPPDNVVDTVVINQPSLQETISLPEVDIVVDAVDLKIEE